jgi:hypothetical protein
VSGRGVANEKRGSLRSTSVRRWTCSQTVAFLAIRTEITWPTFTTTWADPPAWTSHWPGSALMPASRSTASTAPANGRWWSCDQGMVNFLGSDVGQSGTAAGSRAVSRCGSRARIARPRWLMAFFSARVSSAQVRSDPSGRSTGS